MNQLTDSQEVSSSQKTKSICGFWRRIFALAIDSIILGFLGLVIGMAAYDLLAQLGGYGRLIGFGIALLYFGFSNSIIFNGQTIGKKILKIQVVGANSEPISLPQSLLRYAILGVPFFFNGAPMSPDIMQSPLVMILLAFIVFFMGGATIYLYLFNRKTRQSLHDILLSTFVINLDSSLEREPIWKGHFITLGIYLTIIIVGVTIFIPKLAKKEFFADLLKTQQQIQKSGLVQYSTVSTGFTWTSNNESDSENKFTYCTINAKLNHRPSNYEKTISEIAKIVLNSYPPIFEKSSLIINVIYGYDIGIARAWNNQSKQLSPAEWEALINGNTAGVQGQ